MLILKPFHLKTPIAILTGLTGTFFLHLFSSRVDLMEDSLLLAPLLLCHRDLDSRTRHLLARATVKVRKEKEQMGEQEAVPQLKERRQPFVRCGGWRPSKSSSSPHQRVTPSTELLTVVDEVSTATTEPLREPIRARAEKWSPPRHALEESDFCPCEPSVVC